MWGVPVYSDEGRFERNSMRVSVSSETTSICSSYYSPSPYSTTSFSSGSDGLNLVPLVVTAPSATNMSLKLRPLDLPQLITPALFYDDDEVVDDKSNVNGFFQAMDDSPAGAYALPPIPRRGRVATAPFYDDDEDVDDRSYLKGFHQASDTSPIDTCALSSIPRRRGRKSNDEQLASESGLPVTAAIIAEMEPTELQQLLNSVSLTEAQKQLIREIRRRGRFRMASRAWRERKRETLLALSSTCGAIPLKDPLGIQPEGTPALFHDDDEVVDDKSNVNGFFQAMDDSPAGAYALPSIPHHGRQSNDEQLASESGLPVTAAIIADMSVPELHQMLKSESLTEAQKQLIRKIRQHGIRRMAAGVRRQRTRKLVLARSSTCGALPLKDPLDIQTGMTPALFHDDDEVVDDKSNVNGFFQAMDDWPIDTCALSSIPRGRGRKSYDEQLASEGLPLTAAIITDMPLHELQQMLNSEPLTEAQKQLIRKIRRRGTILANVYTFRQRRALLTPPTDPFSDDDNSGGNNYVKRFSQAESNDEQLALDSGLPVSAAIIVGMSLLEMQNMFVSESLNEAQKQLARDIRKRGRNRANFLAYYQRRPLLAPPTDPFCDVEDSGDKSYVKRFSLAEYNDDQLALDSGLPVSAAIITGMSLLEMRKMFVSESLNEVQKQLAREIRRRGRFRMAAGVRRQKTRKLVLARSSTCGALPLKDPLNIQPGMTPALFHDDDEVVDDKSNVNGFFKAMDDSPIDSCALSSIPRRRGRKSYDEKLASEGLPLTAAIIADMPLPEHQQMLNSEPLTETQKLLIRKIRRPGKNLANVYEFPQRRALLTPPTDPSSDDDNSGGNNYVKRFSQAESNDDQLALDSGLPVSAAIIVGMSLLEMQNMFVSESLDEVQKQLARDIRRRGRNRANVRAYYQRRALLTPPTDPFYDVEDSGDKSYVKRFSQAESNDEQLALDYGLSVSPATIVGMSLFEMRRMFMSESLNEVQKQLVREIRRRGRKRAAVRAFKLRRKLFTPPTDPVSDDKDGVDKNYVKRFSQAESNDEQLALDYGLSVSPATIVGMSLFEMRRMFVSESLNEVQKQLVREIRRRGRKRAAVRAFKLRRKLFTPPTDPVSDDKDGVDKNYVKRFSYAQFNDEQLALDSGLPVSAAIIVGMSLLEMQNMFVSESLDEDQKQLVRDIRKRGKNRASARAINQRRRRQIREPDGAVHGVMHQVVYENWYTYGYF